MMTCSVPVFRTVSFVRVIFAFPSFFQKKRGIQIKNSGIK